MNAACTGSGFSGEPNPSIVVIACPSACFTEVMHERVALPSINTVHAPHWPSPHPNFGPCKPSEFRSTYSSGCAGSHDSTVVARPLTRSLKFGICPPLSQFGQSTIETAIQVQLLPMELLDRKSTRLNSSHLVIS